jgi:3-oxoacyl-[acyl-carrier-protein] synthase-3
MTNEEWAAYVDTSDEWITTRTGIKQRRIAAETESTVDLAAAAAKAAIDDAGLSPADIDEIIVATDTPEVYWPDTAAFVQHRLQTREIPAYDLGGSGCAGFVLGLDIARARAQQDSTRVLVIGVELLSRLMNWRDRSTCVLFGDGAGATVVGAGRNACEIIAATAGTDGSRTGILGREVGGTRAPFNMARAQEGLHEHVTMDGRAVFREAVRRMTSAARDVLTNANVRVEDVALVIPHQANLRIIDATGEELGIAPEKVFVNVDEYGNTGSASIPLALWQARQAGRIEAGDLVLLTSFGAGFHWAAALLRF